jgi:hypothetical protein
MQHAVLRPRSTRVDGQDAQVTKDDTPIPQGNKAEAMDQSRRSDIHTGLEATDRLAKDEKQTTPSKRAD